MIPDRGPVVTIPNGDAPPQPDRESRAPAHLRPYLFKPGQSGNPKGRPRHRLPDGWAPRPKGRSLEKRLRQLMDETGDDGRSYRDRILVALLALAEQGNVPAIKEVLNRVDGKIHVPKGKGKDEDRDDSLIVAELMAKLYAPEDEDEDKA
jgi:hypothetical protein